METQKFVRKPLPPLDAVQVTAENMVEVAEWCQGVIDDVERYIKVRVHHPLNDKQTMAYVGDWVLYAQQGYKVYTDKAFKKTFDPVGEARHIINDEEVAPGVTATTVEDIPAEAKDDEDVDHRSAVTGQYVTEEHAEENPDTTVTETESNHGS